MGEDIKKENNALEIDDPWAEFADNVFEAPDEDDADEEINEQDGVEDEELEEETEEVEDEETEEEIEEVEEAEEKSTKTPKNKRSKEQSAIIALKREKKELEAKLAAAEAKKEEERQKERDKLDDEAEIQRLIDEEGISEVLARRQVNAERRARNLEIQLERDRFERKLDRMERNYPGISDHADEIWKLTRSGLTPAEVYKARYADEEMTFDKKTSAEQAVLARQAAGKSKAKANVTGAQKTKRKETKLSPADERAFQFLKKKDPTMTRERYRKYSNF